MNLNPKISVIIPVYNRGELIKKTLDSIKHQTFKDFELIVVDDCSTDNTLDYLDKYNVKVIKNKTNRGPAFSRNQGIKNSLGELILFTDSDCWVEKDWVENFYNEHRRNIEHILMGRVDIPKSTYVGNCISGLGFPAGGHLGFDKVWKIDKNGFTDHLSSCNIAVPKKIFNEHGLFDEDFPNAGGEDTVFGLNLVNKGVKIKYVKTAKIYHEARTSLKSFIRWQIIRGESNYYIKKKIKSVGGLIKLRMWSSKNIFVKYVFKKEIFLIIPLLFLSFVLQQWGYYRVAKRNN